MARLQLVYSRLVLWQSDSSDPLMRIFRLVMVSPCAKTSMSLMNAVLPEPVGPTMEMVSPRRMVILVKFSGSPVRVVPGSMVRVCMEGELLGVISF